MWSRVLPRAVRALELEPDAARGRPDGLDLGVKDAVLRRDGRALDAFHDPLTNTVLLPEAAALESQATFPPVASSEMGHLDRDWTQVAARIQASKPLALATNIPPGLAAWIGNRTYPELFEDAFGTLDVTPARIAMKNAPRMKSRMRPSALRPPSGNTSSGMPACRLFTAERILVVDAGNRVVIRCLEPLVHTW